MKFYLNFPESHRSESVKRIFPDLGHYYYHNPLFAFFAQVDEALVSDHRSFIQRFSFCSHKKVAWSICGRIQSRYFANENKFTWNDAKTENGEFLITPKHVQIRLPLKWIGSLFGNIVKTRVVPDWNWQNEFFEKF